MVGVIGLGNMGHAIATRLLAQGEELTVWNRTADKAAGLDGANVVGSPSDVVDCADVVLSVLANDAATQDVYFGDGGILSTDLSDKVIVEMCTTSPDRAKELAAAVEARGGRFLECPVGGTIGPALEGKLLGLAGGSDAAFKQAQPVLEKLTRRLEHFGAVGTGAAMKLAINLPLMVYWSALGEALGIAKGHGVDPTLALDVLSDSSGAIGAAKKRVPPIRDMVVDGNPGGTNFALENAIKDMTLMLAEPGGGDVVKAALERSKAALDSGYGGRDCSLVAALYNEVDVKTD